MQNMIMQLIGEDAVLNYTTGSLAVIRHRYFKPAHKLPTPDIAKILEDVAQAVLIIIVFGASRLLIKKQNTE